MSIDKLLVTLSGGGLICLIYWFFLWKKEEYEEAIAGEILVKVDGGYKPSVLKIAKGVTTTLKLIRKDPNICLEEIVLPEFKIKKYLPLNKTVEIKINPKHSGEFAFQCGMNMYHGKIVVE